MLKKHRRQDLVRMGTGNVMSYVIESSLKPYIVEHGSDVCAVCTKYIVYVQCVFSPMQYH